MIKYLVQIYTYAGLPAICIGILFIVVWTIFTFIHFTYRFSSLAAGLCFAILFGLILLGFATMLCQINWTLNQVKNGAMKERNKLEASVEDNAKNGYKIYVDGNEVEYDNIDLSKYSIEIDTKKKKIILSK